MVRKLLHVFAAWLVLFMATGVAFAQVVPHAEAAAGDPLTISITVPAGQTFATMLNGTVSGMYVDWGDTGIDGPYNQPTYASHTYTAAGSYTVKLFGGTMTRWGDGNQPGFNCITAVASWGALGTTDLRNALAGADHLLSVPSTLPPGITNLAGMFVYASRFNQDLSGWDTSAVTDMSSLFAGAAAFNNGAVVGAHDHPLQHSGNLWDTSKVTSMNDMFANTTFDQDIGSWDVSRLTTATQMFYQADFNRDIGSWNVGSMTNFGGMFIYTHHFNQDLSNWDTHSAVNMAGMFNGAVAFNNGDSGDNSAHPMLRSGNKWNTSNVTNMASMFQRSAFNQSISNWDVSGVQLMTEMFHDNNVFNQSLANWNPVALLIADWMFTSDWAFNNGGHSWVRDATHWNTPSLVSMANMFLDARAFNQDVSSWDTSHVTNMSGLFNYATSFNNGDSGDNHAHPLRATPGGWSTASLMYMQWMFNATVFNQDIGNWDVSGVTDLSGVFAGDAYFNQPLNGWNVSNVTTLSSMFNQAFAFNQDLNSWDVRKVTDMTSLFAGSWTRKSEFNGNISSWQPTAVTTLYCMMWQNGAFNGDISGWRTPNLVNLEWAFAYADKFNSVMKDWDVHGVYILNNVFRESKAFDQDLSTWNVTSVQWADDLLRGTKFSTTNYDKLLTGWSSQSVRRGVSFSGGPKYTLTGKTGRDKLTSDFGWYISDAGLGKAVPSITTLPVAAAIQYGQTVADSSLSGGVADVAGTFAFTTPATTPPVGTAVVSVTFTPTDIAQFDPTTFDINLTVTPANQTIAWDQATAPLTSKTYGDTFTIGSTVTSGLAPTYSVTGGCSLVGSTVTMTSGTTACVLYADQAGNNNFAAATQITKTIVAAKAQQSYVSTIVAVSSLTHNPTSPASTDVTAGGGNGSGTYSFTLAPGDPCSIASNNGAYTVTERGAGTCTVIASRAGDANYLPAVSAGVAIAVSKAAVPATFSSNTVDFRFGNVLSVPTVSTISDGTKVFLSSDPGIAAVNATTGAVTPIAAGTVTITMSVAESADFTAIAPVSYTLTITKASRALSLKPLPNGGIAFNSSATAEASGGTAVYAVDDASRDICDINATTGVITPKAVGVCAFTASIAADAQSFGAAAHGSVDILPVAPSAPEAVRAVRAGSDLQIEWSAPTFTGGSTIKSYRAVATDGAQQYTCTVDAPATTCTIPGVPDVALDVSVLAINADGFGGEGVQSSTAATTVEAVAAPTPEPTAEPTPEPSVDPERNLPTVNPVEDQPQQVVETTVNAISLVSAVAATAGAAVAAAGATAGAAAAGGAVGGAAGGSTGGSGGSSGGSSGGARGRSESKSGDSKSGEGGEPSEEEDGEAAETLRHLSKGRAKLDGYSADTMNWGDALPLWQVRALVALDHAPRNLGARLGKASPLLAKILADGAYLRAMLGSLSAVLTIAAVALSAVGIRQADGLLVPPSAWVIAFMAAIGVFDALAGFVGFAALAIGLLLASGAHTAADVRFAIGIAAIGVVPVLLAAGFRNLRKGAARTGVDVWERVIDVVVAPFLAGWAVLQIVETLSPLSGVEFPIAHEAGGIGLAVAGAMVVRVLLEELVAHAFPVRLATTNLSAIPSVPAAQKWISLSGRALFFYFIAEAFVGPGTHLVVGTFLFVLPNILSMFQHRLPNSPVLFHLLPAGLPSLTVSLFLGATFAGYLGTVYGATADFAKIAFMLLPLPGLALSIIKLFGRSPRPGDTRWYQRSSWTWFYRISGVVVLAYTMHLAHII